MDQHQIDARFTRSEQTMLGGYFNGFLADASTSSFNGRRRRCMLGSASAKAPGWQIQPRLGAPEMEEFGLKAAPFATPQEGKQIRKCNIT